jgi:hypothetical protein
MGKSMPHKFCVPDFFLEVLVMGLAWIRIVYLDGLPPYHFYQGFA